MPQPATFAILRDVTERVDHMLDPWCLVVAPATELSRFGWRAVALPPILSGGIVSLTLNSVELGLIFIALLVPFATFFYWVISNLRRLRRTSHEINNALQIIIGRDPAAMKRLQDAHRERLRRGRHPR